MQIYLIISFSASLQGLSNSKMDSNYERWTIEHKNYHLAWYRVSNNDPQISRYKDTSLCANIWIYDVKNIKLDYEHSK